MSRRDAERLAQRGWFGVGLDCGECGLAIQDSLIVWRTREYPVIYSVDPEGPAMQAGLQRGDRLFKIDGLSLVTPEGQKHFGGVKPGQTVRWTYVRDGQQRVARSTARRRPDALGRYATSVARLREDLDRRRAELETSSKSFDSERAMRDVNRVMQQLDQVMDDSRAPEALSGDQRLRYSGSVGDADVEVRGVANVVVSRDPATGELIITTSEATVRVKPGLKDKVRRR
ncbi:MAG: PDZ domain-containing protein [Candidatus Eisenbacteria bacterium]|uniref:PDZ domain-containing protein n=1 Tax=Eiseniibacteriota bacterium TaxID=2212470 RepID=A0A849SMT8_UNCEI|nr:PDZ domain-containing protein [Candidatus Eisenbacteria bacterium]